VETAEGGTEVNAYFNSFSVKETCFIIQAIQVSIVRNLLDSTIEITDYYNPGEFGYFNILLEL
jgi:hypothetical protein